VLSAANALRDGDWATVGATLLASHRSLRDDYAVSTPELDLAVDVLVSVGADGARLTGGGFGGSVVGVVDPALVPELEPELSRAFAVAGQRPPSVREVTAADGARREPVSR
jgi:galactokinase